MGRKNKLTEVDRIIIKGRSHSDKPEMIQVAIIDKNGAAFGQIVELNSENLEYSLKINYFMPVKTVTLPRPYPSFCHIILTIRIKRSCIWVKQKLSRFQ